MSGENTSSDGTSRCISFYRAVLLKIVRELVEAYNRTPGHVSSRNNILRALRLAQNAVSASRFLAALPTWKGDKKYDGRSTDSR